MLGRREIELHQFKGPLEEALSLPNQDSRSYENTMARPALWR
jgi:hypothetical protein